MSAGNVWEGRKDGRSESGLKFSSNWGEGEKETDQVAGRMVHFSVGTVSYTPLVIRLGTFITKEMGVIS